MNRFLLASILVIGFGLTATAENAQAEKDRMPAEQAIEDQVFSPDYLERVNGEQQAMDAQREVNIRRHQKFLNQLNKQR